MHFFHWSYSLSFTFSHDYHFHASGWHFCTLKRFELCWCSRDLWRWSESSLWHEFANLRLCNCAIYCLINRGTVNITTRTNIAHLLETWRFNSAVLSMHLITLLEVQENKLLVWDQLRSFTVCFFESHVPWSRISELQAVMRGLCSQ